MDTGSMATTLHGRTHPDRLGHPVVPCLRGEQATVWARYPIAASGTTDNKVNPGSVRNLRAVPNAKNPRMLALT